MTGWWLSPTPLKNMSSSVGTIIPNMWKNKIHVPNHQPDDIPHLQTPCGHGSKPHTVEVANHSLSRGVDLAGAGSHLCPANMCK